MEKDINEPYIQETVKEILAQIKGGIDAFNLQDKTVQTVAIMPDEVEITINHSNTNIHFKTRVCH